MKDGKGLGEGSRRRERRGNWGWYIKLKVKIFNKSMKRKKSGWFFPKHFICIYATAASMGIWYHANS